MAAYRLILSDLSVLGKGGEIDQQIFRMDGRPLSMDQITQVAQEKLFAAGLEPRQPIQFVGHLGAKRRVVASDQDLHRWYEERGKQMPSLEVQLPDVRKRLAGVVSDADAQARRKQDYIEQLEAANAELRAQWQVTSARVDEITLRREQDREEAARVHAHGIRQVRVSLEDYVKQLNVRMDSINKAHDVADQNVRSMIDTNAALRTEVSHLQGTADSLATDLQNNVEDLVGLLHKADVRAQGLQDQIRVQHAHLHQHDADLARHEEIKVNVGAFEIFQQEMADTVANLRARHQACEDNVETKYQWTVGEVNRLDTKVDDLDVKVMELMNKQAADISDEIDMKCAKTLASANDHTDAIAKKHRDKLAKQKSDLAQLRVDLEEAKVAQKEALQEAQRALRSELSAAAAAIHDAIKNLNEKQAATKAELSLTVDRLNTLKEQCASQFSEITLQQQALNVHSQEGLAAVTRLVNSLKEDHLRYKEKMAGHVSLLQHQNQSNEETCHVLEQERKRFVIDNRMMTDRMNGINDWSADVDQKLMRLYKYVQPTRCEWRIHKVAKKKKELTTPMLLKSPPFSIAGFKDLRFDWYPNGYYGLPAGTSCIRFYAPLNTHIKYECYLGTMCDGPQEWKSGEESLWNDHLFHKWDDEVQHNQLTIAVDILSDLSEPDAGLGGALKIDCE